MSPENATKFCWAHTVSACGAALSPLADSVANAALCDKHRGTLAALDHALVDLDNAMREVERLREVRKGLHKAWTPVRLTVDGARIERAVLKRTIEHALQHSLDDWRAPAWLPPAIFGQDVLPVGCGVALVARVGDSIIDSTRTGFLLAKSERTGRYECAVLQLREGWKLLCSWEKPIAALGTLHIGDESYVTGEDTLFHPRRVSFRNRDIDLGVSLDFDWSGRWSTSKYPNVAKLRSA